MENREGLLQRSESKADTTTSSDFVLQWGNRKRLRRQVKGHVINDGSPNSDPVHRPTTRTDRRVARLDHHHTNNNTSSSKDLNSDHHLHQNKNIAGKSNGHPNLRQRPVSPAHRVLRNSESSIGMKGNNGVRGLVSPDRAEKRSAVTNTNHSTHHHKNNKNNGNHHHNNTDNHHHSGSGGAGSGSSENAHDGKKGGSSSGGDTIAAVWPPKFVIALTNKEKEEDFMAIKGSKLPQRPKKRAKFIQRTLNLVSPGAWLCDLTLDRYEVREKKVTKKKARGLKAMGNNMDTDSE